MTEVTIAYFYHDGIYKFYSIVELARGSFCLVTRKVEVRAVFPR